MTRLVSPRFFALVAGWFAFLAITRTGVALQPTDPPVTKAVRHCPVTPTEEIDEAMFLDWRGTQVYFCCERCKSKFKRHPEKYASALVGAGNVTSRDAARDDQTHHETDDTADSANSHTAIESDDHRAHEAEQPQHHEHDPASKLHAEGPQTKEMEQSGQHPGDPYYLPTCPISGEKLGSRGEPVIKIYDGREVRFCCNECPPKFEKDKAGNFAKIDEQIVKDQMPLYPLRASLVSAKPLPEKPLDFVYSNRLIRLVEEQEKDRFLQKPTDYLKELDKAVVARQGRDYSLTVCAVSKDKLGQKIGKPQNVVLAGRLIRLCCSDCRRELERTPAIFVAEADAAHRESEKNAAGLTHADQTISRNAIQEDTHHGASDTGATAHDHAPDADVEHRDHESEEAHEPSGHHEHGHGQSPKLLNWLGKFHPVTLHLPIGVLLAAVFAEILFARRRTPLFDHAGRFCVWVATVTGVVTATLGWFFGGLRWVDTDWLLAFHRWLGTATAIGFLILLWTSERMHSGRTSRFAYRLVLFGIFCLVGATGFFGGAMVWGLDHYAW